MLTVTFAFIVATLMLLAHPRTRALGVVGVFILLCIHPLFFGGLLLLVAACYAFVHWRDSRSMARLLWRADEDSRAVDRDP